jgi:hypothetical protein
MADRLNSKSSVVPKSTDIFMLEKEPNSVVGPFNFRRVVIFYYVSDKDCLKKVNRKLPDDTARSF